MKSLNFHREISQEEWRKDLIDTKATEVNIQEQTTFFVEHRGSRLMVFNLLV